MGDVFRFPPPPRGGEGASKPLSQAALRAQLEEAAHVALDAADRILAALDRMGGDPDPEAGGAVEPDLEAPADCDKQIVWFRGSMHDLKFTSPDRR